MPIATPALAADRQLRSYSCVRRGGDSMITDGELREYQGGCHCGAVRFELLTDLSRVSECNCSMCSRKGFLHHIVPPERFRLVQGESELTTYRFGTQRARHLFCKHCGISAFYRPRKDPSLYTVN